MWLVTGMAAVAAAQECPAALTYIRATGFVGGFDQTFWASFADGLAAGVPPQHAAAVRARALPFWQPLLAPAVDRFRAERVDPVAADSLTALVPCRLFEKGGAKPDGHRKREVLDAAVEASATRWHAALAEQTTLLMPELGAAITPILQEHAQAFVAEIAPP